MAEELSNFNKIVPAPAISLRGDELTTIEACSLRSWSDPGVDITGIFNEAEVELHQECLHSVLLILLDLACMKYHTQPVRKVPAQHQQREKFWL